MRELTFVLLFLFSSLLAKEPILFNTIEKSASVYIGTKIHRGLGKTLMTFTNKDGRPMGYIIPHAFENFIQAGGFAREHLFPTPENIAILEKHQIKMIFHVRDIRQQILSFAHDHYNQIFNEKNSLVLEYMNLGIDFTKWSINDFIENSISITPAIVTRILGWLDVYKKGTIPMLITTYEEFLDNEEAFFKKVLEFYEIPFNQFNSVDVPKDWNHKFRNGTKDEWRHVFTQEQQERINAMIPDKLFELFHWER